MQSHIIVDSEYCFSRFQLDNKEQNEQYYTTSPYLVNASQFKESFKSLEEHLNRTELDNLSKASYDIATDFSSLLNELCSWRGYADLNLILAGSIQRCVNAIFYKGFLLQGLFEKIAFGDNIICVGDTKSLQQDGLELQFGRFDSLFVHIVSRLTSSHLSTYHCELPDEECRKLIRFVTHRKFSRIEKILSILNNTPSSFCYKTWKKIYNKKLLPFESVRLTPFPRKNFYFYKDSELAEELFLSLLVHGANITFLPSLPKLKKFPFPQDAYSLGDRLNSLFLDCTHKWFEKYDVKWNVFYDACSKIVSERIYKTISLLKQNLPQLTEQFEAVSGEIKPNSAILTNSFSSGLQRLFACFCKTKKIKTIVTEHGLTTGFSEYSKYREAHSVMTAGDIGIYHSDISARQMDIHAPEQQKLIFGLPSVTAEVKLPSVQRFLARRLLNLNSTTPLIIYVCDIERNNFYFGPYTDTEYDFCYKTKNILHLLFKKHPDAQICLKLYPTMRYYERYKFGDLCADYPHLIIPEDVDFRFIRAAADHIYTTSFLSTLGWVIGSGKPYTFINVPWSPVTFSTKQIDTDKNTGFKFMQGGLNIEIPPLNMKVCSKELLAL